MLRFIECGRAWHRPFAAAGNFSPRPHTIFTDAGEEAYCTVWGVRLWKRFDNMFSEIFIGCLDSCRAANTVYRPLEPPENISQNLFHILTPHRELPCSLPFRSRGFEILFAGHFRWPLSLSFSLSHLAYARYVFCIGVAGSDVGGRHFISFYMSEMPRPRF